MTIEALLTENNAKLGAILEALTKGGVPAATASTGSAAASEPAKRGRGRPVKGEETAPVAAATPAAGPAEDDESFLDDEVAETPPAKKYTKDDVRAALIAYGKKHTPEASRQLLKKEGGADTLSALAEDKYATVVAAANK